MRRERKRLKKEFFGLLLRETIKPIGEAILDHEWTKAIIYIYIYIYMI